MSTAHPNSSKSVLIVGAGAAGLVALKELSSKSAFTRIACYEQRGQAGGIWTVDADSPMYASLRTNVPAPLQTFRSLPYIKGTHLYPGPTEVRQYLDRAAEPFLHMIYFKRRVMSIGHTEQKQWRVTYQDAAGYDQAIFDYIILASGHHTVPHLADIAGLATWKRKLSHTAQYKKSSDFLGETILMVGARASGSDIAKDLARNRQPGEVWKMYHCIRDRTKAWGVVDSEQVEIVGEIDHVFEDTIVLKGGREITDVDHILLGTGYEYSFPFCRQEEPFATAPLIRPSATKKLQSSQYVDNLDKNNLFYLPDPTLACLGLQYCGSPFMLCESQARVVASRWSTHDFAIQQPASNDPIDLKQSLDILTSQFLYEDNLLSLIGEAQIECSTDVTDDGKFAKVTAWRRGLGMSLAVLREACLPEL